MWSLKSAFTEEQTNLKPKRYDYFLASKIFEKFNRPWLEINYNKQVMLSERVL